MPCENSQLFIRVGHKGGVCLRPRDMRTDWPMLRDHGTNGKGRGACRPDPTSAFALYRTLDYSLIALAKTAILFVICTDVRGLSLALYPRNAMIKREDIYMRDPFVFVEGDVAYLIGTTDENCWGGKASGFLGYKSTDLENFEGPFVLFENDGNFWTDEYYWAPELHKVRGKYYIVATFWKEEEGQTRRSQFLVCDEVFGRYTPLAKPFTPEEWFCLDATLFEEDGELYSVFSHEWVQCQDGEIRLGKLNSDLTDFAGGTELLFKASEAPWVRAYPEGGNGYVTDGPFVYQLSNGNLSMIWSSFSKTGYSVGQLISENGIHGPWKHVAKPLYEKDGGHGMIFSFKGKSYLAIHYPNEPKLKERPIFLEVEEKDGLLCIK